MRFSPLVCIHLFLFLLLFAPPSHADTFESVVPGRALSYPRDHGAHPSFKTEWWYFTGHLREQGAPISSYGFELVFFRVGLGETRPSQSAWKVDSLYFAHFAVTDDAKGNFQASEQSKRGSLGDAGAALDTLHTWNGTWSAELKDGKIFLQAGDDKKSLRLELSPRKELVLHGEEGFSRKGPKPGDASYYSSFTRLGGSGELQLQGKPHAIEDASVWMDQEFTSSESGEAKVGWDWFALQLDDGEEVMLYQLRDEKDVPTSFSAGTLVHKDGSTERLGAKDFEIAVLKQWTSPETKIVYPAQWRLKLIRHNREFQVTPTVAAQELRTKGSTGVSYWEGRSQVQEKASDGSMKPKGFAYVELVGYKAAAP